MKADGSKARANVSLSQHCVTFPNGNQRYEIGRWSQRRVLSERELGKVAQCFIPAMMNAQSLAAGELLRLLDGKRVTAGRDGEPIGPGVAGFSAIAPPASATFTTTPPPTAALGRSSASHTRATPERAARRTRPMPLRRSTRLTAWMKHRRTWTSNRSAIGGWRDRHRRGRTHAAGSGWVGFHKRVGDGCGLRRSM
jgi:hypothetical protein